MAEDAAESAGAKAPAIGNDLRNSDSPISQFVRILRDMRKSLKIRSCMLKTIVPALLSLHFLPTISKHRPRRYYDTKTVGYAVAACAVTTTLGGTAIPSKSVPGTAPQDAPVLLATSNPGAAVDRRIAVLPAIDVMPDILAPFPNIAVHII
jgi:hypothetical protein